VTGPVRPPVVFAAAYLLAGASALWAAGAVATLFAVPHYRRHYGDAAQNATTGTIAAYVVVAVAVVAFAAGAVGLALARQDARGAAAARVWTWLLGAAASAVAATLLLLEGPVVVGWHRALMRVDAALSIGLVVAALTLLTLPAARWYFRAVRKSRAVAARPYGRPPPSRPWPAPPPYPRAWPAAPPSGWPTGPVPAQPAGPLPAPPLVHVPPGSAAGPQWAPYALRHPSLPPPEEPNR
jgi:hypothetical protein